MESTLTRWGYDRLIDPMALLASELVTNAVIHARSPSEMTLRQWNETLRVEVLDQNPQQPLPRRATGQSISGRGLKLVDAIADRWGTDNENGGKVVWAELHVAGGAESTQLNTASDTP